MQNIPTEEQLARIPKLGKTENTPPKEKLIYLHLSIFGSDFHWFVAEYNGANTFFGVAIPGSNYKKAKWRDFRFSDLQSARLGIFEVEYEKDWIIKPASEIDLIKRCPAKAG